MEQDSEAEDCYLDLEILKEHYLVATSYGKIEQVSEWMEKN